MRVFGKRDWLAGFIVGACMSLLLGFGLAAGRALGSDPGELSARRIQIVDATGKVRLILGEMRESGEYGVVIRDRLGKVQAAVGGVDFRTGGVSLGFGRVSAPLRLVGGPSESVIDAGNGVHGARVLVNEELAAIGLSTSGGRAMYLESQGGRRRITMIERGERTVVLGEGE